MEYNGWKNIETYQAFLWFEEEGWEDGEVESTEVKDALNNMRADLPEICGLFSDFIDDALDRIACHEIAEHITEKNRRAGRRA